MIKFVFFSGKIFFDRYYSAPHNNITCNHFFEVNLTTFTDVITKYFSKKPHVRLVCCKTIRECLKKKKKLFSYWRRWSYFRTTSTRRVNVAITRFAWGRTAWTEIHIAKIIYTPQEILGKLSSLTWISWIHYRPRSRWIMGEITVIETWNFPWICKLQAL